MSAGTTGIDHPVIDHPVRVVEPPAPGLRRAASQLWNQRAAFAYFTRRFAEKRVSRTFLGWLWILLPVVVPLLLGSLVYGGILNAGVPGVPYILYFAIASGAWMLFSRTTYYGIRSLEISRRELRRLYVPRFIPLIASVTLPLLTLVVYLAMVILAVVFYLVTQGNSYLDLRPATLLVPCGFLMLIAMGLAIALWFAPIAPRARDVRRMANYALGVWYFLTPVLYPISQIPEGWRFLASLNPVTAPIEMIKQGLIGIGDVTALGLGMYFAALLLFGAFGLRVFLPRERRDVVNY